MITAIIANTQAADFYTIDAGPDAFVLFRDLEPDHPKPRREFSCLTRVLARFLPSGDQYIANCRDGACAFGRNQIGS